MEECIFCKIIKGQIPSFKVYEDDRVFAFMDINPIMAGHTLIIPKTHAENIWEMTPADMEAVIRASHKLAHAIRQALNPAGIAVMQLNGRAVNQLVMHYHMHLIPRAADDPELTMTAWELVPGDMDTIKNVSRKIVAALD